MRALIDPRVTDMSLLLTDVTVGDRPGRAVHVADGRIAWLGAAADAPSADRVVAGEGALLTPAFVDAHVHATGTGLALTGLDLHSSSSLRDAVRGRRRRTPRARRRHRARHRLGRDRAGPRAAA